MTQRQTNRSRVLRRVGAAVAATIAVSTVAATAGVNAQATSAVKTGGTLKVAIRDTLPKFCTGDNAAGSALGAFRTIYETLFEKTAGGDLVGVLAKNATPSADLKTWTIEIRKNGNEFIKFHDGTNLDADAVAYNMNASRGFLTAAWVSPAFRAPGQSAGAAMLAGKALPTHVLGTSVTFQGNILSVTGAVGGTEVVVTLDRPQNDLTSTLYASGRFFIRSKRQIASWPAISAVSAPDMPMGPSNPMGNGNGFGAGGYCGTFPIGTGPFKVASNYTWNPDALNVVKNADYWRSDSSGVKLPYLNAIEFKNIKDGNSAKNAVLTGGYHVTQMGGATDGTFIKALRLKRSKVTEFKTPYEYYPSLWLNQVLEPAFKQIECREAVALGINRARYVKVRGGNEMRAAKSIVGSTSVMYTTKGFLQYNLTKAKAKFKECLTKAGVAQIEIALPADKTNASLLNSRELAQQLTKVGFKATVATQQDSTDIIAQAFNAGSGNQYKMINILLLEGTDVGFNLPFLVANAYDSGSTNPLKALYGSTGAVAKLGGILNLARHEDAKVAELMWAGRAVQPKKNGQLDMKAAGPLFKKGTEYIQSQSLITSVSHQYVSIFTTKAVGGVGKLRTPGGKTPRIVTNWGIQYTGLYLK
jgi:ABC-type transport system substrate-binding protein